jgi:hypothetical protein
LAKIEGALLTIFVLPAILMTQADVHLVYAPGRLFFLHRYDHPAATANTTPAGEAAATAASVSKAAAASAAGASPIAEDANAATAAAAGGGGGGGSTDAAASGGAGSGEEHIEPLDETAEVEEKVEPYPGATFELIEGKAGERCKRIVLRDSCLRDHLCGGYIQGLEYVVNKLESRI